MLLVRVKICFKVVLNCYDLWDPFSEKTSCRALPATEIYIFLPGVPEDVQNHCFKKLNRPTVLLFGHTNALFV